MYWHGQVDRERRCDRHAVSTTEAGVCSNGVAKTWRPCVASVCLARRRMSPCRQPPWASHVAWA
eukprot:5563580-Pyramimonas_sp.AAC.1